MSAAKKTEELGSNFTPLRRERGGDNVLFGVRLRARIAKTGGDALGDILPGQDIETVHRPRVHDSKAIKTVGGEMVVANDAASHALSAELRDTILNPDYVTADT